MPAIALAFFCVVPLPDLTTKPTSDAIFLRLCGLLIDFAPHWPSMEACQTRMVNTCEVEGTSYACGRCMRNCRNDFGRCIGGGLGTDARARARTCAGCADARGCAGACDTCCAAARNFRRRSAAGS